MSTAQPGGQVPSIRRTLLRQFALSYKLGPQPEGGARWQRADGKMLNPDWPDHDENVWTDPDYRTATWYLAYLIMQLCFEIDAAQAGGRPADVIAFLNKHDAVVAFTETDDAGRALVIEQLREQGLLPGQQEPR